MSTPTITDPQSATRAQTIFVEMMRLIEGHADDLTRTIDQLIQQMARGDNKTAAEVQRFRAAYLMATASASVAVEHLEKAMQRLVDSASAATAIQNAPRN